MPRYLRSIPALAALLAVSSILLPASALASGQASSTKQAHAASKQVLTSSSTAAAFNLGVLGQLNQIRTQHGLTPLTLSPNLTRAAHAHSQEMVEKGYFAHESADGSLFWKRIQAYYPEGSGSWSVGENLFWTSGSASVSGSVQAWMASPGHRANILDPNWRQIGIAAVSSPDAPGTYAGLSVTVITTDFGVRG
jgi:uncharacterized protein YkwD